MFPPREALLVDATAPLLLPPDPSLFPPPPPPPPLTSSATLAEMLLTDLPLLTVSAPPIRSPGKRGRRRRIEPNADALNPRPHAPVHERGDMFRDTGDYARAFAFDG